MSVYAAPNRDAHVLTDTWLDEFGSCFTVHLSVATRATVTVPKMAQNFASFLLVWKGLVQMAFWSCRMYFGMRKNGWKYPVPSHRSFCLRAGEPGSASRVDRW